MPLPALQNNNREMVHLQSLEYVGFNRYTSTWNWHSWCYDKSNISPFAQSYYVSGASNIYAMNMRYPQWGFLQIPNSGIAGAFGSWSCTETRWLGAMGWTFDQTATGGWAWFINTNKTILNDVTGCEIRVIGGTGAGYIGQVTRVQLGTNSILYVSADQSQNAIDGSPVANTFDATTVFRLYSESFWFFNAGTSSVWFSVFDRATSAWTSRAVTWLPTAWGTDAQLVSTPSYGLPLLSWTIASWSTTTVFNLANAGLSLLTNQFANHQIRFTTGALKGQIRVLSATGATSVTTATATASAPSAGDKCVIESADDYFYLGWNNAVTLYRNSVSANTWTNLAPTVARSGAMASGGTADWLNELPNRTVIGQTISFDLQANGQPRLHYSTTVYRQRGRYLMSFRWNGSNVLDLYDISANTWINDVLYGNRHEGIAASSCSVDKDGYVYVMNGSTWSINQFDFSRMIYLPFIQNTYPQSTTVTWDKMIITQVSEDASDTTKRVTHLYMLQHTRNEIHRTLLINR